MNILVLGGHGFFGRNIVKKLRDTDHSVVPLSRRDGLDLGDLNGTTSYFKEIEPHVIINCAAHVGSLHYVSENAGDVIHDNTQMALNLYLATKNSCPQARIINPLSNCSYPGEANIHYESQWWMGEVHDSVFSYANSKRFLYTVSKSYHKQYQIESVNFLVPNTFGPGDTIDPNKTHAVNGMIIRMLKAKINNDKEFEIWGTGSPIREWGYIDDVVDIILKGITIDHDLLYPVNIAQNTGFTIKESAEFIAQAVGFEGDLVFNTNYQDGAPSKLLDDQLFKTIFNEYSFTDHQTAIQKTVNYYKTII
jgi:GDP-L-fucose synthase